MSAFTAGFVLGALIASAVWLAVWVYAHLRAASADQLMGYDPGPQAFQGQQPRGRDHDH